jgi:hypothetical protein
MSGGTRKYRPVFQVLMLVPKDDIPFKTVCSSNKGRNQMKRSDKTHRVSRWLAVILIGFGVIGMALMAGCGNMTPIATGVSTPYAKRVNVICSSTKKQIQIAADYVLKGDPNKIEARLRAAARETSIILSGTASRVRDLVPPAAELMHASRLLRGIDASVSHFHQLTEELTLVARQQASNGVDHPHLSTYLSSTLEAIRACAFTI